MPKQKRAEDPITAFRNELKILQDKHNVDLILSVQYLPAGISPILQAKIRQPTPPIPPA